MENDKWIEKAFQDAIDAPFDDPEEEAEYQAYRKVIVDDIVGIVLYCGRLVGLAKMDVFAKHIKQNADTENFFEFTRAISSLSFHLGYKEGRKHKA